MITGTGNTDKSFTIPEPPMVLTPIEANEWTSPWREQINQVCDALEGEHGLIKEDLSRSNIAITGKNEYILYRGKSAFLHLEYQGFNSSTNATITLPLDDKGQAFNCLDSVVKVYDVSGDYSITEYTCRVKDGVLYVPQIAYSDLTYIIGEVVRT